LSGNPCRDLSSGAKAEFVTDLFHVTLGSALRDEKLRAYLAARQAVSYQAGNF
jgi:hypothetical protein